MTDGPGGDTVETRIRLSIEGGDAASRAIAGVGKVSSDAKQALASMRLPADNIARDAREVTRTLDNVKKAASEAGKATAQIGGGKALGTLTGAVQKGAGVAGLGGVANDALDLVDAIGSLNPLFIAGTVATVGLGVAVGELNRVFAEGKAHIDNEIAARRQLAQAFSGGQTTEEIARHRAELVEAQKAISEQLEYLKETYPEVGTAGSKFNTTLAPITAKFEELQKEFLNGQIAIDLYTKAIFDNKFAANDAAKALQDAQSATVAALDRRTQMEIEGSRLIREATSAQVDAQIRSISDQEQAINKQISALRAIENPTEAVTNRLKELTVQQDQLREKGAYLIDVVEPLIKQREAEAEAAKEASDALNKTTKALGDVVSGALELNKLENDRAKMLAERARDDQITALETQITAAKAREAEQESRVKISTLRDEVRQADITAARKYADDAAAINRDFMASELKAFADFRKSEERATQDYSRDRLRKIDDLNQELIDLAAEGDVSTFISRRRSGLKSLGRESEDFGIAGARRFEDFTTERAEADRQRQQRLDDLRATFIAEREQRQAEVKARLEQEAVLGQQRLKESERLERQLSALHERFAREDAINRRRIEDEEYRRSIESIRARAQAIAPIFANTLTQAVNGVINQLRATIGLSSPSVGSALTALRLASQFIPGLPKFDRGIDYVPRDMVAVVHRGERIVPARQNGGGAPNISIDMRGAQFVDLSEVEARVYRGVTTAFRAAQGGVA